MDKKILKDIIQNDLAPLLVGIRNEMSDTMKEMKEMVLASETKEVVLVGKPGAKGESPVKDVDYLSKEKMVELIHSLVPKKAKDLFNDDDIKQIAIDAFSMITIPEPIPGAPGKDAKPVDYSMVNDIVKNLIDEKHSDIKAWTKTIIDGVYKNVYEKLQGVSITGKEIVRLLESLPERDRLSAKYIKDIESYTRGFVMGGGGDTSSGSSGTTGAVWGSITGNINAQSDLITLINNSAGQWTTVATGIKYAGSVGIGNDPIAGTKLSIIDGTVTTVNQATQKGNILIASNSGSFTGAGSGGIEFFSSDSGSGYGWRLYSYDSGTIQVPFVIQARANSANWYNVMTMNNDTGYVGIGNATPTHRLTVTDSFSNTDTVKIRNTGSGGYASLSFFTSGNSQVGGFGYGNSLVGNGLVQDKIFLYSNSKDIFVSTTTNTTSIMFLQNTNQYVGIGTTSPVAKLTVQNAGATQIVYIDGQNISHNNPAQTDQRYELAANGATKYSLSQDGGTTNFDGGALKLGITNFSYISGGRSSIARFAVWVGSVSVPKLVINNNGQIGIGGQVSPSSLIHANVDSIGAGIPTSAQGILLINNTSATVSVLQSSPMMVWAGQTWETTGGTSQDIRFGAYVKGNSATSAAGQLTFVTSVNGGAFANVLSISQAGNAVLTGTISATAGFFSQNVTATAVFISTRNGITTTATDGFLAQNGTVPTSGTTVQMSPRFRWLGGAWDTSLATNKIWEASMDLLPVSASVTSSLLRVNFSNNLAGFINTHNFTSNGDFQLMNAGGGIYVKEGSNATMGRASLSGGTVVISTTKVTANSEIYLTGQGGSVTNLGSYSVTARTPGSSFTISSSNALDTNTVAWIIIEPS